MESREKPDQNAAASSPLRQPERPSELRGAAIIGQERRLVELRGTASEHSVDHVSVPMRLLPFDVVLRNVCEVARADIKSFQGIEATVQGAGYRGGGYVVVYHAVKARVGRGETAKRQFLPALIEWIGHNAAGDLVAEKRCYVAYPSDTRVNVYKHASNGCAPSSGYIVFGNARPWFGRWHAPFAMVWLRSGELSQLEPSSESFDRAAADDNDDGDIIGTSIGAYKMADGSLGFLSTISPDGTTIELAKYVRKRGDRKFRFDISDDATVPEGAVPCAAFPADVPNRIVVLSSVGVSSTRVDVFSAEPNGNESITLVRLKKASAANAQLLFSRDAPGTVHGYIGVEIEQDGLEARAFVVSEIRKGAMLATTTAAATAKGAGAAAAVVAEESGRRAFSFARDAKIVCPLWNISIPGALVGDNGCLVALIMRDGSAVDIAPGKQWDKEVEQVQQPGNLKFYHSSCPNSWVFSHDGLRFSRIWSTGSGVARGKMVRTFPEDEQTNAAFVISICDEA